MSAEQTVRRPGPGRLGTIFLYGTLAVALGVLVMMGVLRYLEWQSSPDIAAPTPAVPPQVRIIDWETEKFICAVIGKDDLVDEIQCFLKGQPSTPATTTTPSTP